MRSTSVYKRPGENLSSGVKKTDWKARADLRFVEREVVMGRKYRRILQQKWIKAHPQMQGERITWDEEWRDVPLVEEFEK